MLFHDLLKSFSSTRTIADTALFENKTKYICTSTYIQEKLIVINKMTSIFITQSASRGTDL